MSPFVIVRGRRPARRAFSLIELLASIAIIGVLAATVFAVSGKIRSSADRTRCASNLRQVGVAIQLYTQDNQGRLPGPCYNGQGASGGGQLATFLVGYLTGHQNVAAASEFLLCPAWKRAAEGRAELTRSYYLPTVAQADGTRVSPFGYRGGDTQTQPLRLREINNPARARAIVDFDQGVSASSQTVATPVHDTFRNALFFDGRVESIPLSRWNNG